jgi:hypothetical protein
MVGVGVGDVDVPQFAAVRRDPRCKVAALFGGDEAVDEQSLVIRPDQRRGGRRPSRRPAACPKPGTALGIGLGSTMNTSKSSLIASSALRAWIIIDGDAPSSWSNTAMPATVDDRDVHWHTHRIGARDRPVHDGGCIA